MLYDWEELNMMYEEGLISKAEYKLKVRALLEDEGVKIVEI